MSSRVVRGKTQVRASAGYRSDRTYRSDRRIDRDQKQGGLELEGSKGMGCKASDTMIWRPMKMQMEIEMQIEMKLIVKGGQGQYPGNENDEDESF